MLQRTCIICLSVNPFLAQPGHQEVEDLYMLEPATKLMQQCKT